MPHAPAAARRLALLPLLALALAAGPARADEGASEPPRATPGAPPAVIRVWNQPVAELRATVAGATPEERARRAEGRIGELPEAAAAEVHFDVAELAGRRAAVISAGGLIAFALFEADLPPESGGLEPAARDAARRLGAALQARDEERHLPTLLREAGVGLLETLAFALVLWLLVRGRRAVLRRVQASEGLPWRVQLFGVDLAPLLTALAQTLIKAAALLVAVAFGYAWLTAVLGRFEYTRPWADGLGSYLAGLASGLLSGALGAIPGLFAVGVILALTRAVASAASGLFERVETGRIQIGWLERETARATRRIVLGVIWVFGAVVAYPYIPGSETGVFKGVSVFVGIMFTLGSSNIVNQLMSGLVLVYSRALRPGDYVRVGEVEGTVTHVGVLSTKVANLRLEEVTVPNAVLVAASVTNYSRLSGAEGAVASTTVTIGYDAPWRQVHALLTGAAAATPGLRAQPAPRVLQRALSDFYVEYQLLVNLEACDQRLQVLSDLHAAIQDAFNQAGVRIMSPHFMMQPDGKVYVPPGQWDPSGGDPVSTGRRASR
ncbi:MAG: mechanosensitive ion channel [Anaeromyxobacter sp.]